MSDAESASDRVGRDELFEDDQAYHQAIDHAARLVRDGIIRLNQVTLAGFCEDDVELRDGVDESFRQDVEAHLDVVDDGDQEPDVEPAQRAAPESVPWRAVWDEFGFGNTASRTQLTGALELSEHTEFGRGPADTAIAHGVETGALVDIAMAAEDGSRLAGLRFGLGGGSR